MKRLARGQRKIPLVFTAPGSRLARCNFENGVGRAFLNINRRTRLHFFALRAAGAPAPLRRSSSRPGLAAVTRLCRLRVLRPAPEVILSQMAPRNASSLGTRPSVFNFVRDAPGLCSRTCVECNGSMTFGLLPEFVA